MSPNKVFAEEQSKMMVLHINSSLASVNDKINQVEPPILFEDTAYAPLRFIAENLGAKVSWHQSMNHQSVTLNTYGLQVEIPIGGEFSAKLMQNTTYVPLRLLAETLGQNVVYENGFIVIYAPPLLIERDFIPKKFSSLKDGLPFKVFQNEQLLDGFLLQEDAVMNARQWSHASVRDRNGGWIWDNYPPFHVYQHEQVLDYFDRFADAVAYAKQYANSFVYFGHQGQTVWSNQNALSPSTYIEAPHILQFPELARGCEVTALAMLLQHAGVNVNKMTLAAEITKDETPFRERNGKIFFGDPSKGFVGDMYTFSKPGFGVYQAPIYELAASYLPGQIINLTESAFEDLYFLLQQGSPIWVITNMLYEHLDAKHFQTWHTPSGEMKITRKEHSVLIVGYDDTYIYINDPYGQTEKVTKASFIEAWEQMGKQAITYVRGEKFR